MIPEQAPVECDVRAVSARLRHLRRANGMTQATLARELGTTQSAVARLESGRQRLSLEAVQRVAAVLGCEVAVFIERKTV